MNADYFTFALLHFVVSLQSVVFGPHDKVCVLCLWLHARFGLSLVVYVDSAEFSIISSPIKCCIFKTNMASLSSLAFKVKCTSVSRMLTRVAAFSSGFRGGPEGDGPTLYS